MGSSSVAKVLPPSKISEYWQDGIPLWEKKYCTIVGLVPWQKIVDSKMFVYCHSNVFDWNDSAAEEALQNAKNHYWAKINSLPCDISLPDPDTYNDQIDWNPYIDPDMIKEIDKAFFTLPDEEQETAMKNKRTKTSVNDENPLECSDTPLSRALENNEVQRWNQGNSGDVDNTDNPWECSVTHGNGRLTDNAWEGGPVKSWGWNEGRDHNQCKDWNSENLQDKGWGKARDSSWCQQQSNNLANFGNSSWQCKSSQQNVTPLKTGWRNSGANGSGWKQQEKADVSRRNYGGWTAQNKGNQWREGSHWHTLGSNGSQFQRDGCQTGHYWGKEKSKKRDFVP
ncbi:hypothetical protein JHK85_010389 [Glycine max]|uniref:Uncharacterized protein n=1 Tax=Glycine soja TaxID=3848 RepID=A0A445L075_GLYSO|nr:uncharacterized protein LOC114409535 isoform X2 [Glycine soja]KAG5049286.1 hypothetical protein JHK85_010389 [Glycine max]RZC16522.1 hypothetical protein D0Y65_009693 [Glycine soja]